MVDFLEKYRPKTYLELAGKYQREVAKDLLALRASDLLPNLIFFGGKTGVGKTTISKIIADGYSYQHISCREVGVDYIRTQILDNLDRYSLLDGGKKVYLLDEVDALSNQAQQSLLVKLENLPKHIHIIVATKDPQKLRKDFVDRFLPHKYDLTTPSRKELIELIFRILDKEKVILPTDEYETMGAYIIDSAGGSVRGIVGNVGLYINNKLNITYEEIKKDEKIPLLIKKKKPIHEVLKNVQNFSQAHIGICNYMLAILKQKEDRNAEIILKNFSEFRGIFSDQVEFTRCLIKCYEEMS